MVLRLRVLFGELWPHYKEPVVDPESVEDLAGEAEVPCTAETLQIEDFRGGSDHHSLRVSSQWGYKYKVVRYKDAQGNPCSTANSRIHIWESPQGIKSNSHAPNSLQEATQGPFFVIPRSRNFDPNDIFIIQLDLRSHLHIRFLHCYPSRIDKLCLSTADHHRLSQCKPCHISP